MSVSGGRWAASFQMDRSQMYDFTFIVRRMRVVIEFTSAPWLYSYHGAFLLCFLGVFLMLVAGTLVEYYRDNVFLIFLEKNSIHSGCE